MDTDSRLESAAAGAISLAPPRLTVTDYGDSALELETLRRMVEQQCPMVQFGGYTTSGARAGEYRFRLPPKLNDRSLSRSVYVQAPVTPHGRPRGGIGLWHFRTTRKPGAPRDPWKTASMVETVVGWICRQVEWSIQL